MLLHPKKGDSPSTKRKKGKAGYEDVIKMLAICRGDAPKKAKTNDPAKNVAEACAEKSKKDCGKF